MAHKLTTTHHKREHSAYLNDNVLGPYPTEIDLVRELNRNGVDLKQYEAESERCRDNQGHNWTRISWWRK